MRPPPPRQRVVHKVDVAQVKRPLDAAKAAVKRVLDAAKAAAELAQVAVKAGSKVATSVTYPPKCRNAFVNVKLSSADKAAALALADKLLDAVAQLLPRAKTTERSRSSN